MRSHNYLGLGTPNQPARNRFQSHSGVSLASLALAAGFILSGCASDDATPTVDATNSRATATTPVPAAATEATAEPSPTEYIPASAEGPARNVPLPQRPWEIDYPNEKGAKAAVQYWFDTLQYVELTGNPEPLKEISDPNCAFCNFAIEQIPKVYDSGSWMERGRYDIREMSTETDEEAGVTTIFGTLITAPSLIRSSDGTLVEDSVIDSNLEQQMVAELYYSEEQNQIMLLSLSVELE